MNKNLPIPKNEVSRLGALAQYNILDTLPEEEFDRLTQLAAIICGVPIALISLIDKDRQWFKSKIGLDAPETPRDISFCQYTINGESLFEIEDATKDGRFLSNPLVTDQPNIRFYAGFPLIDPDGYALGSLCLIDREARKLTSDQRRVLTLLANEVVSQIVSRKKNAEKDKLEKMFNLSIDLKCVAGADGYFKKINPAFTLTLGWTIEELLAKPFCDFIHPDDVTITSNKIKKLTTGEKTLNFENRFITKNGDYLSINWNANSDEITGELYAVGRDITERKKAERLLIQIEERNRLIMDSSLNAIITIDVNGRITFWNKRAEIIFGWKNGEVFGKVLSELIIPHQYIEAHNKGMKHYLKTGDGPVLNTQIEITALNKAGDEFPIEMAIVPLKRNDEQFFSAFIQDISSRKKEELLRKVLQEKYQNIIANMNLGLLEVDIDEKIQYANQQFCNMSGFELDELLGKKASDLFVREESRELIESKNELRKKSISDAYEISVTDKKGEHRWWLISGAPNYNDKGELIGSIGIHLDITVQKRLELELVEAKNSAEASTRAKETFLANMSHEIRTPMNAIIGMSNQLAKTNLVDQQKLYLNTILSAADFLLIIINDILDLSKIEAGKLALEHIGFEPQKVIEEIMHVMMYKAEEKGILFTNSFCDIKLSPVLIGDPFRLNQVMLNLISNSIKFTEKGRVDIACVVIEDNASSQKLKITVRDTGIGMEGSFVKQIFEKFSQESKSGSRKFGGTGLGMSISKDLVELMKGEILVQSKKGLGTSISVILEFEKGDFTNLKQNEGVQISNDFLSGKKILVTDDNDHNRLIASIILQDYGAEIYEAINGQEALVAIEKYKVDLVLMDIQMPVLNGYEATKMIRDNGNEIPVIAMTANVLKGENENCIAAGMNDYISKPFKEEDFLKTIAKWLTSESNLNVNKIEATAITHIPAEPLYDLETIKAFSRGNEAFIQEMVNLFCEQTPLQIEEMKNSFYANDLQQMGAIAHKIKPSLDNFNISLLKQDIRTIEEAGKDNMAFSGLSELLEKTRNTVSKVISQMKQDFPC